MYNLTTTLVGDRAVGAGVDGDATSIRVLCRSVPVRLAEQVRRPGRVFADLERSEYRFEARSQELRAGRGLVHSGRGSELESLGGPIAKLRFRYHDGSGWGDTFDSLRSDRLPRAVEVAIWFDPWPGWETEPAVDEDDASIFEDELPGDEEIGPEFGAGFDENAYADLSDLDLEDEPWPDRIRVLLIPDAETPPETPREPSLQEPGA